MEHVKPVAGWAVGFCMLANQLAHEAARARVDPAEHEPVLVVVRSARDLPQPVLPAVVLTGLQRSRTSVSVLNVSTGTSRSERMNVGDGVVTLGSGDWDSGAAAALRLCTR